MIELRHSTEKSRRIVVHMDSKKPEIERILSGLLSKEEIEDIEIRDPSLDTLFRMFLEK